jgi:hypothetical protein
MIYQDNYALVKSDFVMQSILMNPNWAEENLQTIRTLMERSAVYRRALAPIMIFAGTTGILGGLAGWLCRIESNRGFVWLWLGIAIFTLAGALLLVRRQSLKDAEPFWSPPTRRVGQALLPAFFVGLMIAAFVIVFTGNPDPGNNGFQCLLVMWWSWCYGCAIHAAGFFMPRGVRWLGWIFILIGSILSVVVNTTVFQVDLLQPVSSHLLMGGVFGGLHLAYGIHLHFTEQKSSFA